QECNRSAPATARKVCHGKPLDELFIDITNDSAHSNIDKGCGYSAGVNRPADMGIWSYDRDRRAVRTPSIATAAIQASRRGFPHKSSEGWGQPRVTMYSVVVERQIID